MDKKLTQGKQCNYEIALTFTKDEQEQARIKMLRHFQKDVDVPGFRKGNVPLDMVAEQVKPEYMQVGLYEQLINQGLQDVLKEHEDKRFIGEPYDINQDQKNDNLTLTLKLDVYPVVEVINDKRQKETIKKVDPQPTKEEEDQAFNQLQKQYAEYKDAENITEETVSKVKIQFMNKDDAEIDKGTVYVGEQEFAESDWYKKTFVGKKKDESFELKYTKKDLPATFHYTKEQDKPTKIIVTPTDVKQVVMPTFDEKKLQTLFGNDTKVKNEADLKAYIKETIAQQKQEQELVKHTEDYIKNVMKESMHIMIPQTLVEQEYKSRVENLHQRFGSKEHMQKYFEQIGEEKKKEFLGDIQKAAKESLEKFFVLQKIMEELNIDIDWKNAQGLEAEKKLYEKVGEDNKKEPTKKKEAKK